MGQPIHVVAFSGGKDSTAMVLRMREVWPRLQFRVICTPTGDELPELNDHWKSVEEMIGVPIERITNRTLDEWIQDFGALPNWRQRWCTRLLKIEPCLGFLSRLRRSSGHDPVLYVGLRADEEARKGIYSEQVQTRFPLREWGWGLKEVQGYLARRGVSIPGRTDCARCYGQRLIEWFHLWRDYPERFNLALRQEKETGHTFRSPQRDQWPTALADLAVAFKSGKKPPGYKAQVSLPFGAANACRVCSL